MGRHEDKLWHQRNTAEIEVAEKQRLIMKRHWADQDRKAREQAHRERIERLKRGGPALFDRS